MFFECLLKFPNFVCYFMYSCFVYKDGGSLCIAGGSRLLTESTLEAAIKSRLKQSESISVDEAAINSEACLSPRKVAECRICQDEDFDSDMEAPCSCSGSLKYAHRRCVQKWCNEKGDTMCEICHQPFKPGYTAAPPIFHFGRLRMNLRGNWQIARRDLNNPRIIAMVSTDLLDPEYDEYDVSTSRIIVCYRTVAIIFMVLFILRHTLPMMVSRGGNYSLPFIMFLMLRVAGIILPICIILKAVTSFVRRRQQEEANPTVLDEESSPLDLHQPDVNIALS